MPGFFPRFFLSSSNMATEGHLTPFGVPLGVPCATGSCATPVVTPLEMSMGCSLRRPRLIFSMVTGTNHPRPIFSMVTGTSPDYLSLLFSYSVYKGVSVLTVVFLRVNQ